MARLLTKKQQRLLAFISNYWRDKGEGPSRTEMGRALGVSATAAHFHLLALERKGYLRRIPHRWRGLELLPGPEAKLAPAYRLPIVGEIAAGRPMEAYAEWSDYLPVVAGLAKGEDNFILRVKGDSMVGDGIHHRDLVIVQPQSTAQDGDMVVALLEDNTVTLKRLYREKDGVRLQPANPKLKPLRLRQVTIQGKVVALLRNYE